MVRKADRARRSPDRRFKHGLTYSPEWRCWQRMLQRAHTGSAQCARDYIGRGIRVCERWLTFTNFLADMGPRPARTSLDRINNDGNYEPGNCRWATPSEQNRNKRTNRMLTARGLTQPLAAWAAERGLSEELIAWRLRSGWSPERALFTTARHYRRAA